MGGGELRKLWEESGEENDQNILHVIFFPEGSYLNTKKHFLNIKRS